MEIIFADTRGGQTSKKKKKNRNKGKEKKKTSSINVFASTEASALEKITENSEQDLNASNSAYTRGRGSAADRLQLLGTQHESFNADGDIVDNDLDPALLEGIDRVIMSYGCVKATLKFTAQCAYMSDMYRGQFNTLYILRK
ncbi:uncharacterized protein LOC141679012 isoform X2 [Apium graveolens]|uniref:uncharacterized protein LOC141679012 isoform X2 n=1 Tax=Apium graveolens TaxID=4045 RepID=UPI003D7BD3C6